MIKQIGTTNFLIHNIKIIIKSQLKKALGIFLVTWVTQWKFGAGNARQFLTQDNQNKIERTEK